MKKGMPGKHSMVNGKIMVNMGVNHKPKRGPLGYALKGQVKSHRAASKSK